MKNKLSIGLLAALSVISLLFFIQCDAPKEDDPLEGCFIATAVYGSSTAEEIDILRQFRDEYLSKSASGIWFIENYYRYSPPIAAFIAEHYALKTLVREYFVNPTAKIVKFTEHWWSD